MRESPLCDNMVGGSTQAFISLAQDLLPSSGFGTPSLSVQASLSTAAEVATRNTRFCCITSLFIVLSRPIPGSDLDGVGSLSKTACWL